MKKIIKNIKEWWAKEKKAFRKWMKWRRAEKEMVSKGARKEFKAYADKMVEVFDIDKEAVLCELAKETFTFVNYVVVEPGCVKLDCRPEKMSEMTALLRWFAKKGYHQIKDSKESTGQRWREWNLEKIEITGWFESTKPDSCRYVEVGKREVPIMKMVCPGDEDYPKEEKVLVTGE